MKQVGLTDIKKARKLLIPGGIVVLGVAAMVIGQTSSENTSKAAVTDVSTSNQTQTAEEPAPTAVPEVTVNGQKIPTDKKGSTTVDVPGGKAQVEVSDGHTRITTSDSATNGDTSNSQSGNVNISLDSKNSNGTSSTRIYGYSNSSTTGTTSISSTQIISSESTSVSN